MPISVVLNIQQTGRIIIQTYLTPRDRQLSLYTTSASFIKKRAPYERKQLFYPIKRISGIVATRQCGWSVATYGWSARHPPVFRCYVAHGRWIVTQHCSTKLSSMEQPLTTPGKLHFVFVTSIGGDHSFILLLLLPKLYIQLRIEVYVPL